MKPEAEIQANLQRASASIQAAKTLLHNDYPDFAASRAYYAAFYAAVSLLLSQGMAYRKHSGVIVAIHRDFVKPGRLAKEHGKALSWLFELRGVGDYGMTVHVTKEEAAKAITAAEKFIQAVLDIIETEQSDI